MSTSASTGTEGPDRPDSPLRPVRVVLVDDDPMVLQGLTMILGRGSAGRVEVVGTAGDGAAAVTAVQAHHPDVVLMDLRMPVRDGISATAEIVRLPDAPRVLVLTTFDGDDEPVRAARAGAVGFLLKTESPEDVIAAVLAAARGEGAVSRRTARQLMAHIGNGPDAAERERARRGLARLTDRERDVADLVAEGLSNREIAGRLYVSEGTVKTHLAAVQDKLGVANRVLVAVAVTLGRRR